MKEGDLVVATKYSDGDTQDHFVVGFFNGIKWHGRYNVVDDDGKLMRGNGFRKAKKITNKVGRLIVDDMKFMENSSKSVWDFVAEFEKQDEQH